MLFTWLQMRIPREPMGRVMSLLFFCAIGLAPVSTALAGAILQSDLNGLFIGGAESAVHSVARHAADGSRDGGQSGGVSLSLSRLGGLANFRKSHDRTRRQLKKC
jgi:hypothetical protein